MSPSVEDKNDRLTNGHAKIQGPFPISGDIMTLEGSLYATPQLLVQQIAYSLSGSIFAYSPESFELDNAVSEWSRFGQKSAIGIIPKLYRLESRAGAASILLGYLYNRSLNGSNDNLEASNQPQSVLASSRTLEYMKPVLAHFALEEPVKQKTAPIVFHIAAVDYDIESGHLVTDYLTATQISKDLGLGLIASLSVEDSQHIALLATILSSILPTIHIYEGIRGTRETTKTSGVLNSAEISDAYEELLLPSSSSSTQEILPISSRIVNCFTELNSQLGTDYKPFEYIGNPKPETVIVSFGSDEGIIASQVVKSLLHNETGAKVGAINVRLYSPFLDKEFLKALPASTKNVIILGQVPNKDAVADVRTHSYLYSDVATALLMKYGFATGTAPHIIDFKYSRDYIWEPKIIFELLGVTPSSSIHLLPESSKQFVFWDVDTSKSKNSPVTLAHTLSLDPVLAVDYISTYDNEVLAGLVKSDIRISAEATIAPYPIQDSDVVFINDAKITSHFNVFANVKNGSSAVIASKHGAEELEKILNEATRKTIIDKSLQLFTIDYEAIGENPETLGRTQTMVQQIAFWKLAYPELTLNEITTKIVLANGVDTELVAATVANLIEKVIEVGLKLVELIPDSWAIIDNDEVVKQLLVLPSTIHPTSFTLNELVKTLVENDSGKSLEEAANSVSTLALSWENVAKKVIFKEAYGLQSELRPDLSVKNFVTKVQVNERVTPDDYNRHIFHLELDISGTGLKYGIGEALGVHAPNDSEQVNEFIEWYGLDSEYLVSIPAREDSEYYEETKTVYQVLKDNLDLFGKPPKKFFESLALYARDIKEKLHLERLASADGADELKRRTEEDFNTYVDILKEFKSAHPSIERLTEIISPLKRREYSIASSQNVHPNAVHLLIVVVDWVDSKGRQRYGQCSRFLSQLSAGAEVIVSVKPSVMKLPALSTSPIIMSGLGTGLAPFKAFLEEKAWQKANGHEIGEVYLFLGSRHQRQEYLYGELFEAYKNSGILTYIGAAFSRDQPQKIYIQDRIKEAKDKLVDAFVTKKGSFYLCGPTWPVPDISAALADIVATEAATRGETIDAAKVIESLKEEERYILEVY